MTLDSGLRRWGAVQRPSTYSLPLRFDALVTAPQVDVALRPTAASGLSPNSSEVRVGLGRGFPVEPASTMGRARELPRSLSRRTPPRAPRSLAVDSIRTE